MISHANAQLQLTILNSKAQELDKLDVFTFFSNAKIPPEITLRLEDLWGTTKIIGGKIIHAGEIIVHEIIRFIEENPNLSFGIVLGAAIGAVVGLIPFLGGLLTPLLIAVGAYAGFRLDREQKVDNGILGIPQEVILLARKFFELFANIFMALKDEFSVA